jgi:predicted short-subunit dehydrogenase-like oxidoreductase (DUF2520 family)
VKRRPRSQKLLILGRGRVGGALYRGLKSAGWTVTLTSHSARIPSSTELVILAVPDSAVSKIRVPQGPAVVHCAGALELDAVKAARRGSFHPLVAVSSPKDSLQGGWVAISAGDPALMKTLRQMARALKMHALEVPEHRRAAYHAGAVMSAGLVIALLDAAAEATGLDRKTIEPALIALAASALRGAAQRGLRASLTGPVVRGDAEVVHKHLDALPEGVKALYRALSRRAQALAQGPALDGIDLEP